MPAPRGNTNALKHGLYAQALRQRALQQLGGSLPPDFQNEKQFINLLYRRVEQELSNQRKGAQPMPERHIQIILVYTLTRLLHNQGALAGFITPEVETAFAEVLADLHYRAACRLREQTASN